MRELCLSIPTHIDTRTDSKVCHLLFLIQTLLEAALLRAIRLLPARLEIQCKLQYIRVSSSIPKKNFHDADQISGME